jgi:hypothetical protein
MALIGTKEQREEISAGVQAKNKRFCGQKNTNKNNKKQSNRTEKSDCEQQGKGRKPGNGGGGRGAV